MMIATTMLRWTMVAMWEIEHTCFAWRCELDWVEFNRIELDWVGVWWRIGASKNEGLLDGFGEAERSGIVQEKGLERNCV